MTDSNLVRFLQFSSIQPNSARSALSTSKPSRARRAPFAIASASSAQKASPSPSSTLSATRTCFTSPPPSTTLHSSPPPPAWPSACPSTGASRRLPPPVNSRPALAAKPSSPAVAPPPPTPRSATSSQPQANPSPSNRLNFRVIPKQKSPPLSPGQRTAGAPTPLFRCSSIPQQSPPPCATCNSGSECLRPARSSNVHWLLLRPASSSTAQASSSSPAEKPRALRPCPRHQPIANRPPDRSRRPLVLRRPIRRAFKRPSHRLEVRKLRLTGFLSQSI